MSASRDVLHEEYCAREALATRQAERAADPGEREVLLQTASLWRRLADQRRREIDGMRTFHVIQGGR
jgi:hypothetical protein